MISIPTGTVTFLFTDIEGSTKLWESFPRAMQVALARHDIILRQAIESHDGYVFKTVGDAFCAAFPTAPQALRAALSAQQLLHEADWGDIGGMNVRMALHTGAAEVRENDYFGQPVNRVARLLSTGYGEQILLTLATQQLVRDDLPPDSYLKDLGEGGLRDLVRTEHIYQVVAPGLPAEFPPLKSLDTQYVEPDALGRPLANPYKGLRAFHQEDAGDFFGREDLTERLVNRLRQPGALARFLAVVGPSGSGKSSVVRAGLVPALKRGAVDGSERWLAVEMLPGPHPLEELEAVLLSVAVNPPESLVGQLREDIRGLSRAVKRILPRDESVELFLVIDQFEEVFTLVEEESARVHFLESLHSAVTDPHSRFRVIATLRADFYDRPLLYPDPGELVRQRTEVVLPLTVEELDRAVTRPAGRVGVQLEPELVATILRDVGSEPGTLPLLEYALTELFENRRGRVLALQDYRASGGVFGALSRRAETLYAGLSGAEQEAARQLFLRLITLGEGTEDTRRRVRRAELLSLGSDPGVVARAIETFGQYRLLTFDRDPVTHDPTVEVAHEALIRTWPRLREWLDATRERLRVQRQLTAASSEWAKSGRDRSFLATGARLVQFETLAEADQSGNKAGSVALTSDEMAYLEASVKERERERTERERLRRRITTALAAGLVITAVLAALAVVQSIQANEQRNVAVTQALARATAEADAEARRKDAEQQQKLAFSRELAAKSRSELGLDPNLGLLLAIEAAKEAHTDESEDALRYALLETQPHAVLRYPPGVTINDVKFGPNGKCVALSGNALAAHGLCLGTTSDKSTTRIWEVSDRTGNSANVIWERFLPRASDETQVVLVFSPSGKDVLVGSSDNIVWVWDISGGTVITQLKHTEPLVTADYSPDGKSIVTSTADGKVHLWDLPTSKVVLEFAASTLPLSAAIFSPGGESLLTTSRDGNIQLWDAETGKSLLRLQEAGARVNSAAFSPDGKLIITSSDDNTARVWDAATGKSRLDLKGHTGPVHSAAFSPDGKLIITSSDDNTARVWDAATGKVLANIEGRDISAISDVGGTSNLDIGTVAFAPDNKRVLISTSVGSNSAAYIFPWNLFTPYDQLLALAPGLATRQFTCEERQTYLHENQPCGTPTEGTP